MAFSSSCSTVKSVNSRWTSPRPSPVPKLASLRLSLLPELRYTPNLKLTATNALRTVEQTKLTEENNLSTYGSDQEDLASLPKPRILVAEKLGEAGVNLLREFGDVDCSYELSPEDLKKKVSESDALIVRSGTKVTREVFEAAKGRLKVVGRAGVGIDNVDLQAATEYGCLVVNAPTANTVAAAEHGIALLASMARNVAQADASTKAVIAKIMVYYGRLRLLHVTAIYN
ncbi:unnamed protein product [Eruca vesicaria subsp. sativa]|uniref:D-isomer specific 2-hydroxyacid dehydrogenase catalytic domain-containing protein n=1 Tax=Eruca vesicaria subsp. sativa TaxID=29727 RepID=A0ABC8LYV3_ERUVS|nr:unnamed protein product [Eruca vesicaria subsp. sativa]